jgi:hypothetical protein
MKSVKLILLFLLCLQSACGEDPAEDYLLDPDVTAFAEQIAQTSCLQMKPCCENVGYVFSQAECEALILGAMSLHYSENVALAKRQRANCITQIGNELGSCQGTWPPNIVSCRNAFAGMVEIGDECHFNFECKAQGTCTNGRCVATPRPLIQGTSWGQRCDSSCVGTCVGDTCVPAAVDRVCSGEPQSPDEFVPDDECSATTACTNPGEECVLDADTSRHICLVAGQLETPCRADGSCDVPLSCVNNLCVPAGDVGQPCYSNLTCDEGGYCSESDWCTTTSMNYAFDACCVAAGNLNEPCKSDNTCNAGLVCVSVDDGYSCDNSYEQCCVAAGGEEQQCLPGDLCNDNLFCIESTYGEKQCVAAGNEDEPCLASGECNAGLVCDDSFAGTCYPFDKCCVAAGGEGEACFTNGQCDTGFVCSSDVLCMGRDQCCVSAGDEGEPCLVDETCNSGLECVDCTDGPCCAEVGDSLEPCLPDLSCHGELSCAVSPECPSFGIEMTSCCHEVGGIDQPCRSNGTCDAPGECYQLTDTWEENTYYQCIATGAVNEPCTSEGVCDEDLICSTSYTSCGAAACCIHAGLLGEPCLPEDTCAATTLQCLDDICVPDM